MDPRLLAVASSGSWKKLQSFLNCDPCPTSSNEATRISAIQQPSCNEEAVRRRSFLNGVTVEGDTFLHVMATNFLGEDLAEDGLGLIRSKVVQLLFVRNRKGDTALHCAARADKPPMVSFLLDLATIVLDISCQFSIGNDATRVKALLQVQNNSGWTVLHEAVRVGNNYVLNLLMMDYPDLARFPQDGTSPMYLAILRGNKSIAQGLYEMSGGVLSYSGPNGQNALHAAVFRGKDLTKMILGWNNDLTIHQDENGSTPLHLAASILAASILEKRYRRTIHLLLLEANPDQLYQADNHGLFPIHVAASINATVAISDFLKKSPSCAGLRDARGRTFLHVAVNKRKTGVVRFACINQSLSWILNMQDNDGNTALHLAVKKGSLTMFCSLMGNCQVQLSITNEKGETPLDVAHRILNTTGLHVYQNSETKICFFLQAVQAKWGISRQDYFEENDFVNPRPDATHTKEVLKDSTQNLCISSVLIATVTFGATFAMPGGYRGDDTINGGTPTLAGRYAFDAFILANALAFAFSAVAVVSLISSGSPLHNLRSRILHLGVAFACLQISVTSLVAAFALGTYAMLAPVAHKAAIIVCVLSSSVLLFANLEIAIKNTMVIRPLCRRTGICHSMVWIFPLSALSFLAAVLFQFWPIVVIFGLTALNYSGKLEPAAQPPTPFP